MSEPTVQWRDSQMPEPTVRDCMHRGVIACAGSANLEDVARLMGKRRISALVVVENGVAVGVISQTDLVNAAYVQPYLRHWRGIAARHLMTSPVVSVRPDVPLPYALEVMRLNGIHRLVVTELAENGERPVGILSFSDIARAVSDGSLNVES